jgi:hypothetical protein
MIIHKDKRLGVIIDRQTNAIITVIPDVELGMWLEKRKKKIPRKTKNELPDSQESKDIDLKMPSPEVTLTPDNEWMECAYCKVKGHLIKECQAFYDPEKCELELAKGRNNIECHYCHRNTHLIKKCPKLKRKRLETKRQELRKSVAHKQQESLNSKGYTMVVPG